jgi:aspartate/methionine/tyrosine aminotransferase
VLRQKAGVATLPGNAFGQSGEGFIRISCTKKIDVLKEAFDRIEKLPEFMA